jgi:hypothetical protein
MGKYVQQTCHSSTSINTWQQGTGRVKSAVLLQTISNRQQTAQFVNKKQH